MSTIRVARRTRFATIDQRTIRDDRLSFRARGVLVWLLDKPDDWEARSESIANAGIEGRDAIRNALRELEALGYIVRHKWQNERGHWQQEAYVYERPQSPGPENPASVSQASGDQALIEEVLKRTTETKPLRGTTAVNGGPDERVQKLVAGYVDDYAYERGGHQPSVRWRGAAGKAAKTALEDGEDVEDIARCFGVIAHEGKNPSALPHVLSDYHANRPRRIP